MLLKFRNKIYDKFTHYTEIADNEVKRYIGPFSPYDQIQFRFAIPILEDLRIYFNNSKENTYLLKIPYEFYFIEGGNKVIHSNGAIFFYNQNITHFRIGNNPFQPIQNISYYHCCRFVLAKRIFQPISGINVQFSITSESEIEDLGLQWIEI